MSGTERGFPIQGERGRPLKPIPWSVIEPHEAQAKWNHDQTLERLAQRGGLSPCEAIAVLEDRQWHQMKYPEAEQFLYELVNKLKAEGRSDD